MLYKIQTLQWQANDDGTDFWDTSDRAVNGQKAAIACATKRHADFGCPNRVINPRTGKVIATIGDCEVYRAERIRADAARATLAAREAAYCRVMNADIRAEFILDGKATGVTTRITRIMRAGKTIYQGVTRVWCDGKIVHIWEDASLWQSRERAEVYTAHAPTCYA